MYPPDNWPKMFPIFCGIFNISGTKTACIVIACNAYYATSVENIFLGSYFFLSKINFSLKVKQFPLTNWPYSLDNILYLNHTLLLNAILTK